MRLDLFYMSFLSIQPELIIRTEQPKNPELSLYG